MDVILSKKAQKDISKISTNLQKKANSEIEFVEIVEVNKHDY